MNILYKVHWRLERRRAYDHNVDEIASRIYWHNLSWMYVFVTRHLVKWHSQGIWCLASLGSKAAKVMSYLLDYDEFLSSFKLKAIGSRSLNSTSVGTKLRRLSRLRRGRRQKRYQSAAWKISGGRNSLRIIRQHEQKCSLRRTRVTSE